MLREVETTSAIPSVVIGGFPTASVTRSQLADTMVQDCLAARARRDTWRPRLVFSSNGQGIALAGQDRQFASAMAQADIVHADGMPVVFASKLTGKPLPERIATTDFFHDAAMAAARHGFKFFILGATDAQNKAAVEAIGRTYPELEIVGRHHGYFDDADDERICATIRASGAEILWVGLGKPRQEFWCVRNRHRLAGIAWIKTCGGLFAFLAGDASRAPEWMQRLGLEWLYRMLDDPKRLAWRYFTTNPYSLYRLLRYTKRAR